MSETPSSWQPVLDGPAAETALSVVRDIASALSDFVDTDAGHRLSPNISGGHAGIALLYAYLDIHLSDQGYEAAALDAIGRALNGVDEVLSVPGFFGGFPGVAWTAAHLEHAVWQTGDVDDLQPLDEALAWLLERDWTGPYDLISGLVGIGVYALERPDSAIMTSCLERTIERISTIAEHGEHGVCWKTEPWLLPARQRELAPRGYYSLGLAHGVPGVVALLAHVYARADADKKNVATLLAGAMDWIAANELSDGSESAMPTWIAPGSEPRAARAAWCYGDPGVAIALLQGALALDDADRATHARGLGIRAARRPMDQCGVRDAGLCHGAAGLAHIFNRMYQATGDPEFADAARRWLQRVLDMREPGAGIAGYLAYEADRLQPESRPEWRVSPGLLTGAAGIALVLLAAVATVEPAWDRHLLCAIP